MISDPSSTNVIAKITKRQKISHGNENPDEECHSLPCTIHHDESLSSANVKAFFNPVPIPTNDEEKTGENNSNSEIQAVQFRGRGLLGRSVELAPDISGMVMKIENSGKVVEIESSFERMLEWEHTHNVNSLELKNGRVQKALDWFELSHAVHDPIPL